jgi:hypothetical protein
MANVLALQQLKAVEQDVDVVGNSCGSSTCVGCSCSSNGCGTRAAV